MATGIAIYCITKIIYKFNETKKYLINKTKQKKSIIKKINSNPQLIIRFIYNHVSFIQFWMPQIQNYCERKKTHEKNIHFNLLFFFLLCVLLKVNFCSFTIPTTRKSSMTNNMKKLNEVFFFIHPSIYIINCHSSTSR